MNHYEILGIDKDSTIDEIKKAYRKLAIKNHPDKTPNDKNKKKKEELFKKITESYQILSDPKQKEEYDCSLGYNSSIKQLLERMSGENNMYSFLIKNFVINNIDCIYTYTIDKFKTELINYFRENILLFTKTYGISSSFILDFIMNSFKEEKIEPENIEYHMKIKLDDIFIKKKKLIKVNRKIFCKSCSGNINLYKCKNCMNIYDNNIICSKCDIWNFEEVKCNKCTNGYINNEKIFDVPLNVNKVIFCKEGDLLKNYSYQGNIEINITIDNHELFQTHNHQHLSIKKKLSLYEWIYHYSFDINHPNGEIIPVSHEGTINKNILKIKNMGIPEKDSNIGNLYIILELDKESINENNLFISYPPLNKEFIEHDTTCTEDLVFYPDNCNSDDPVFS